MYLKSLSHISLQEPLSEQWLTSPLSFAALSYNRAIDPDFKEWISPMSSRRMSSIVKRAIVTSKVALQMANKADVDAIICGTGLGCVENTELFLKAMVHSGEQFLQPTHFIQSTHNTIASQIALTIGCHGYNSTYVHRGVSFESALLDGFLQFKLGAIHSALIGGHEEITQDYYKMLNRVAYWRERSFSGEGSVSFVFDANSEGAMAEISAVDIFNKPEQLIRRAKLMADEVDALVLGVSGNEANDQIYEDFASRYCPSAKRFSFKNLSGDYFTASAFGLYAAVHLMHSQGLESIVFYNHYQNRDHALILIHRC